MTDDETIMELSDAALEQYFLSAPDKLELLVQAADIQPTDHVVEVGAGIGTVAIALPSSASLTLIELDSRLAGHLQNNVPNARVIHGDAIELINTLPCDVLVSNLPTSITERLFALLPQLNIRTAVMAVGEKSDLTPLVPFFSYSLVTIIGGSDFKPPQPLNSRLIKLSRRT